MKLNNWSVLIVLPLVLRMVGIKITENFDEDFNEGIEEEEEEEEVIE